GDDANDFVNSQISVDLNLSRPIAPTLDSVGAGENSISVEWSLPSTDNETDDYIVYYSESELVAGDFPEETVGARSQSAVTESVTLTDGVQVDRTYNVAVVMLDSDGNRSVLSNVEQAVTTPTRDFYEQYLASGGVEQGGLCSSARVPDGGMMGAAAVLGLLWTLRRRGPRS
ncbi:MAG: fibronectin type III domain-containing protein, partial [Myxococcales bacterium]|nr:fibronectin type III domain-containing protein [Myxococcales bacterium]